MRITEISVDRSITIFVLLLLVLVAGLYSYSALPREKYPEIVIPIIIVSTPYEGVAPADMETLVTIPIERKLAGLSNVREMKSWSSEGMSTINIEFEPDEDVDTALQRVRDKVDQARPDLPDEADDSEITEVNFSEFPIMFLSLTGDVGLPILTEFAERLEEDIETLRGVLEVRVIGGVEREIQIIVDPDRASQYGISMIDLVQLAQVENVNTPAGSLHIGEASYLVRVPGEFRSAEDIENLVVQQSDGGVVYMRDIATVVDGFKDVETISRLDGVEAVTLSVIKRSGVNIIHLSDEVHAMVDDWQTRLLPGMRIHVTMDESEDIRDMVSELENSILSGLILVLVVIFIFLGFMNAIFVALAIPVSMLIAFIAFYVTGTSLNMVVLFSLMLALGMLVDNGIVVIENIYRHMQQGLDRISAAKKGAAEVAWPITSSTMTTMAAFAPMFFWPGIWGEFMFFLPLTVTLTLAGSLFVGLIVNPSLAGQLMRFSPKAALREGRKRHPIIKGYSRVLRFALRWRGPTVVAGFTLLVVIATVFFNSTTVEFEPRVEPGKAVIDIDMPEGTRIVKTDEIVSEVEQRVEGLREHLAFLLANVGSRGARMDGFDSGGQPNIGQVSLQFPKLAEATIMPSAVLRQLQGMFSDIPGAEIIAAEDQQGPPTGPPINVDISGQDFDVLARIGQEIRDRIADVPDIVNIRDDHDKGTPEVLVHVDRQQALLLGLNTQFIGQVVQTAINGRKAGEYREGDKEYDVVVKFPEQFRQDLANLEAMTIINMNGDAVPFSAVARLEHGVGFGRIQRLDRKRTLTVSADVQERSGTEVLRDVQARLEDLSLPPGYAIAYTGENEEAEEAQAFLSRAFIIALFLIALVLVTQFNSVIQPFIIMTSVILSLAGVFLGLYIFQMPFGILMTGIGCISLAGVVVNNAIVLIDFINQRRADGADIEEAIVDAGMTRFRPVMLTAITTILGLIPMALGVSFDFRNWNWIVGGESSQYWGPMATAVIFGLAFATILTLVVVPVLYSLSAGLSRAVEKVVPEDLPAEQVPAK